jgi:ABC-type multidrug transport system permease subunit
MLVMFVFQMILTYGGASLVNDRLGGRLRRLLATPVHPLEAYAGKVLARIVMACLQAFVLLLCGALIFHLPLGDHPLYILPVVLCLAAVAGSLSLVVGVLCTTEKQVILVAIFGSMALAALGGCWWPIEIVPETFKTVARLTPSYWSMHGLQSVLYFGRAHEVLTFECPVLLGFAALFALVAVITTRLRVKGSAVAGS